MEIDGKRQHEGAAIRIPRRRNSLCLHQQQSIESRDSTPTRGLASIRRRPVYPQTIRWADTLMLRQTRTRLNELGSLVYENAVIAMNLPELMIRALLSERLAVVGLDPKTLTIELLSGMMPQIEDTLRMCLPPTKARSAMAKLTTFIIEWDAPDAAPTVFEKHHRTDNEGVGVTWKSYSI